MRFSPVLHAALPLVTLILLATSAYHVATGLGRLALSALGPRSSTPSHAASHPESALASRGSEGVAPLLARNPFDSTRAPPRTPVIDDGFLAAPDCETIAAHIVTESSDRAWSLASLRVAGEARPRLCRVGDEVAGHRVEFIGFNPRQSSAAVWLKSPTRICQASVAGGAKMPAPSSALASTPELEIAPEITANVQRLSDSEFNLRRPAFEKLFENTLELGRRLRIVPEKKDGLPVGVRLFGVRPGTWLGALGIRNGDRVESVNGFEVANPEKLLEAYGLLRTASELEVKLTRNGAPMQIGVHIR